MVDLVLGKVERISQDYPLTLPSNKQLMPMLHWARSHSISMTVFSSLMDDLRLSPTEDVSCELKQSRITRNASDLKRVIAMFNQSMNPFSPEQDQEVSIQYGLGKSCY